LWWEDRLDHFSESVDNAEQQNQDEERFWFDHLIELHKLNKIRGGDPQKVLEVAEKTGLKDLYLTYLRNYG
jgi:hypothetical protein